MTEKLCLIEFIKKCYVQSGKSIHQYFRLVGKELFNIMILELGPLSNERSGIHDFFNPSIFEKMTVDFWPATCTYYSNLSKIHINTKTVFQTKFSEVSLTSYYHT